MENSSKKFGEMMRAYRGSRSQVEFARYLGIKNQATYFRYESGRIPKADILQAIANRIGITVDRLLGRDLPLQNVEPQITNQTVEQYRQFVRLMIRHSSQEVVLQTMLKILQDKSEKAERRIDLAQCITEVILEQKNKN
ncbi:MAG: helix-turn-helix transcriptional regulator [Verrucomicrobia bacterium]|nr:helix-turn-helix transcriptional regulator [Verrucomicrobiota bacterium]